MRVGGGPNIVEDGLVLHLDVANQRSFRGNPNINYAPSDLGDWTTEGDAQRIPTGNTFMNQPTYNCRTEVGANYRGINNPISGLSNNDVVLLGCWIRNNNSSNHGISAYLGQELGSYTIKGNSGWQRVFWIVEGNTIGNHTVELRPNTNNANKYLEMTMPQVLVNPSWTDLSNNSNHGELVSGIGYNTDNRGTLVFDGVNDYISFSDAPNLLFLDRTPYTLEAWFYITTNPSNYSGIFNRENSFQGNRDGYNLWIHPISSEIIRLSSERFQNGSNRGVSVDLSSNSIFNSWQHVCVTYDGSNLRLYYNTNLVDSRSDATEKILNNSKTLEIGRRNSGGYFNGRLAEQKIYNRVLSSEEIKQNFNATKWRFGL